MAIEDVREMWTRGDYTIVGDWFAEASRAALTGLELDGRTLLDVACGTGAVALAAARAGAKVTGLDVTPAMLVEARRRAEALRLEVDWREASFDDLADVGRFDVVASSFGIIFAGAQEKAAADLLAACAPGGVVSIVAWRPEGAFGRLPPKIAAMLPPAAQAFDPCRWATAEGLKAIFDGLPATLGALRTAVVGMPFDSADDVVDQMLEHSGPWQMLYEALSAHGAGEVARAALRDHVAGFVRPTADGIILDAAYSVARIRPA